MNFNDRDIGFIEKFFENKSERTVESYTRELERFYKFLQESHKKNVSFLDVTEQDANEFKEYLKKTKYKKRTAKEDVYEHYKEKTITRILRTFLSFYEECMQQEGSPVKKNPFYSVEVPIIEVGLVNEEKIYTEAQNQIFLSAAKKNGNKTYAIVLLFEGSHFKVQEILNFCWADLGNDGMGNWTAEVLTTGGKTRRIIPIRNEVFIALMEYRKELGKQLEIDYEKEVQDRVFLNNRKAGKTPMTEVGIRKMIERLCIKAGLPVVTPKELIHISVVLDLIGGCTNSQILEQTGGKDASYYKSRYKQAKRKYLTVPACKQIQFPTH